MKKFMKWYLKAKVLFDVPYLISVVVIGKLIRTGVIKDGTFKECCEIENASVMLTLEGMKNLFKKTEKVAE